MKIFMLTLIMAVTVPDNISAATSEGDVVPLHSKQEEDRIPDELLDVFFDTFMPLEYEAYPRLDGDVDVLAYALASVAFDVAVQAVQDGDLELKEAALDGLRKLSGTLLEPGSRAVALRLTPQNLSAANLALIDIPSIADIATDFTPGVSTIKDLAIIATGFNPVTQEQVSDLDKAIRVSLLVVPGSAGLVLRKFPAVGKALQKPARSPQVQKIMQSLVNVFAEADRAAAQALGAHLTLPCVP